MIMPLRSFILIVCAATMAGTARGQGTAGLSVSADAESAYVILDGTMVGRTPLRLDDLAAGTHTMRVLHPDLANWNAPVIEDTVLLAAGEVLTRNYRFEDQVVLSTEPSGVDVIRNGEVIGRTPLSVLPSESDTIEFRRAGFLPATVSLASAQRSHIRFVLERDPSGPPEEGVRISSDGEGKTLPLVLSGVSSIIAGGFAAYFKVQADQAYGDYLLTGDPVKLARTRKLDNVAGIALGASQIYFALFSYLLITQ